ncbi:MAG: hypothetical protein KGQ41_07255 [Alphaproteobacteria bacterium]|nr:hypothetical protein [Alphaproteobacteria bacterium]
MDMLIMSVWVRAVTYMEYGYTCVDWALSNFPLGKKVLVWLSGTNATPDANLMKALFKKLKEDPLLAGAIALALAAFAGILAWFYMALNAQMQALEAAAYTY